MNKIIERPLIAALILLVLAGYLFFFRLGGLALTDPDETFYAQTAKEMMNRREWLTPYLYDKPQFEKPILFYWLVEASFRLFGVNEFAARLPSALLGTLGLIAIYFLGAILFNKRAGFFAAIILATNVEYIVLSRACVTDMALATFMLFGALFFFYGYLREKGYFYLLSAAAFALATLTKGPVAIILPAAAIVISVLLTRDFKILKKIPFFQAAIVFLAVAAPWFLLMYKFHGKAFQDAFFGFQNITRFLQSEHKIGSQVYYNIPIILGGFFPWSAFLPYAFWRAFKKAHSERKHLIFILSWFFVIFIFFSASSTKLPTYIFPSFISLALIVAVIWDDFLKEDRALWKPMAISHYLWIATAVIGAVGALIFIKFDYPEILTAASASAIFVILGTVLSFIAFINKKFTAAFFFIAYSAAIFLYPLSELALPAVERFETSKEIAGKLASYMKPGERLGAESNYLAGLAFYTGKFPVNLDQHHILCNFLGSSSRAWAVLKEKNHRELYELDSKPYYTKPSYMVYKVGKRAIITNLVPEDGKYIIKRERKK